MLNKKQLHTEKIKAYLAGELDAKEMHAIEKQALEDPFFAEAMEGLMERPGSVEAIGVLQQRLADRVAAKKTKRPVARYWPAAAILLLLLGAGYVFINFNHGKKNAESITSAVVKNATSPPPVTVTGQKEDSATPAMASRAETIEPSLKEKMPLSRTAKPAVAKVPVAVVDSQAIAINNKIQPEQPIFKKALPAAGIAVKDIQNVPAASVAELLEGRVAGLNTRGDSPVFMKKQSKTPDGFLKGRVVDSVNGRPAANRNDPYIARDKSRLDDVAVAGFSRAVPNVANMHVSYMALPENGWKKFHKYIARAIAKKYADGPKDTVIVTFSVLPNGNPDQFKIEKGMDEQHIKESIILIKNGPGWKPAAGGEIIYGRVELYFP